MAQFSGGYLLTFLRHRFFFCSLGVSPSKYVKFCGFILSVFLFFQSSLKFVFLIIILVINEYSDFWVHLLIIIQLTTANQSSQNLLSRRPNQGWIVFKIALLECMANMRKWVPLINSYFLRCFWESLFWHFWNIMCHFIKTMTANQSNWNPSMKNAEKGKIRQGDVVFPLFSHQFLATSVTNKQCDKLI